MKKAPIKTPDYILLEDEFKDTIISSNDKAELTRYILKMMEEEN